MTIVPARRLSPAELLSLGNNTHAAARNDHDHHRDATIDDPVFVKVDSIETDPEVEHAIASEHVAS